MGLVTGLHAGRRVRNSISRRAILGQWAVLTVLLGAGAIVAHDGSDVLDGRTHTFSAPARRSTSPWLALAIVDDASGKHLAARFQVEVNGRPHIPTGLGPRGVRIEVAHHKKNQRVSLLYSRGEGTVIVPLPDGAESGTVMVSHGFEYMPALAEFSLHGRAEARVTVRLKRWIDLQAQGWHGADAHVHLDRLDTEADSDWLTILAADGLAASHFLTLKGGNLPGLWARQPAHGPAGQATAASGAWIRPGTEYRDRMQGHVSLLGPTRLIEPVSTGGLGEPSVKENYPPLHDVMQRARDLGGLVGVAHGNALGRHPTGLLDAVLGAADFIEIANTHRVDLDAWYLLLDSGIVLPPAAGTDLPNNPFRDPWQPLLGETRMYVRAPASAGFDGWKVAVSAGAVVVSSGPWLELDVAGVGPGGTVHLPPGGGEVRVTARMQSPRPPHTIEIVHNGRPLATGAAQKTQAEGIHQWRATQKVRVEHSGWFAARGYGVRKQALRQNAGISQREIAHTSAVRVLVGDSPILLPRSARRLSDELTRLRDTYRRKGTYGSDLDRDHVLRLFDEAITRMDEQLRRSPATPLQK